MDLDLAPLDASALESDRATIYAVTPDLRIAFVNAAWTGFALDNGAKWDEGRWDIGTSIMDAIPPILRPFYERLFETARTERAVVEHDYECSSPTMFRRFRMRLLPCMSGAVVVVHTLVVESPHTRAAAARDDAIYRGPAGLILQCSHCRRVRHVADENRWDWVPAYVAGAQASTSHGLCRVCLEYHYPVSPGDDAEAS